MKPLWKRVLFILTGAVPIFVIQYCIEPFPLSLFFGVVAGGLWGWCGAGLAHEIWPDEQEEA